METLKNIRDYVDYIITGDDDYYEMVDITELTVNQYDKLMRHFDGTEVTIYAGRRPGDEVTIIKKTWENPKYNGVIITAGMIDNIIKHAHDDNIVSALVAGSDRIYTCFDAARADGWMHADAFMDKKSSLCRYDIVDGYLIVK